MMKKIAPLFILLAGILWGSMGVFVRKLNALGMGSMEIVALRTMVTGIAMFLFLLFFQRNYLKIHIRDIWCFLGTGICSIVFFNVCYFKAITLTSLSVAAVLLYTAPAFIMVMSYFLFGEKMTKRKLLALLMTFLGCVFVTGVFSDTGDISAFGILCGLGAGVGYALYSIFSRYALEKGYHSLTITFYTFLIAAVVSFFLGNGHHVVSVITQNGGVLVFSAVFGIVCTVMPYLLYTAGLNYVENSTASIIASIEPVTATVLGVVLFHESVTLPGVLGVFFVLGALFLCRET
jgi:drug/metabolite transporter (DMT)-like permease